MSLFDRDMPIAAQQSMRIVPNNTSMSVDVACKDSAMMLLASMPNPAIRSASETLSTLAAPPIVDRYLDVFFVSFRNYAHIIVETFTHKSRE